MLFHIWSSSDHKPPFASFEVDAPDKLCQQMKLLAELPHADDWDVYPEGVPFRRGVTQSWEGVTFHHQCPCGGLGITHLYGEHARLHFRAELMNFNMPKQFSDPIQELCYGQGGFWYAFRVGPWRRFNPETRDWGVEWK